MAINGVKRLRFSPSHARVSGAGQRELQANSQVLTRSFFPSLCLFMNERATIGHKTLHSVGGVSAGHLEAVQGTSRHVLVDVQNANNDLGQLFCHCNDLFSATTSHRLTLL